MNCKMQKKKIEGHDDSVLCCHVPTGAKLLVSGGEDGQLCFTDLNNLSNVGKVQQAHGDAVTSVCSNPTNPHIVYASAGQAVLSIDLRKGLSSEEAVCDVWSLNQDEVNHIAVNRQGSWLAAADDSGEVQVISLQSRDSSGRSVYKTLRRGHSNICSAVAFRPHRPWEVISGGLDSAVVRWDFNRLRPQQSWNLSTEAAASGGQVFNPPMVHSLVVPDTEDRSLCRVMAVARGDGCISVYDIDSKPLHPPSSSCISSGGGSAKGKKGSKARQKSSASGSARGNGSDPAAPTGRDSTPAALDSNSARGEGSENSSSSSAAAGSVGTAGREAEGPAEADAWRVPFVPGRVCLLGREHGGHTAAVNCLHFLHGSGWQHLLSAGNDGRVLLWDWQAAAARQGSSWRAGRGTGVQEGGEVGTGSPGAGAGAGGSEAAAEPAEQEAQAVAAAAAVRDVDTAGGSAAGGTSAVVLADVKHGRKVNWVCSFESAGGYNVVVADVTRRMLALAVH